MNLREQVLHSHTKPNALLMADWIGDEKQRFDALMQLFLFDNNLIIQRSAWVLSLVADKYPELVFAYLPQLLIHCQKVGVHTAVKRNVTRLLQQLRIPKEYDEEVMNVCFEFLLNQKESIAVRCFSMGILAKLCHSYPEMKNELKLIIEEALAHQEVSAAFKSKSKSVLKGLYTKPKK